MTNMAKSTALSIRVLQRLNCAPIPDPCYNSSMQREIAIAKLKAHEAELKQLGVAHLYLFGSTARNSAQQDSDVDLFFDYERGKLGLFELMEVKERTSIILGCKADIMTRDSLHKTLRARIEAAAVPVF
jgi:predicted nucleotidyltransferase